MGRDHVPTGDQQSDRGKTCLDPGAGNDIRFITRFEIDKLPEVEKPNLVTLP